MSHRHDPQNELVAAWLRRVAASEEPPASLASAGQILWKAEILQRLEDEDARVRRAARPAEWCRRVVGAVALGAVLSMLCLTVGRGLGAGASTVPASWILAGSALVLPLAAAAVVAAVLWRDA